jgi:hypothetical protein
VVFGIGLKIQSNPNRLVDCGGANSLELNVGKCKSITFSRLCHPVDFFYMLAGIILDRVDSITDLGVVMDSRMSLSKQIDVTVGKVTAMLGFVKRLAGEFRDPYTFRISLNKQVVNGGHFMTCMSIGLSVCRESSLDTPCGDWDGRTCMIFLHTWAHVL